MQLEGSRKEHLQIGKATFISMHPSRWNALRHGHLAGDDVRELERAAQIGIQDNATAFPA